MAKRKNKQAQVYTDLQRLFTSAQKLRNQREILTQKIEEVDAKLADLELTWNDLRKDISVSVFGEAASAGEMTMTSASESPKKPKKSTKKKWKKRRKAVVKRKSDNLGTRAQIQKAAKTRDIKVKSAILTKPEMNLEQIFNKVNYGTRQQIQTSLKRLRKKGLVKCEGAGKSSKWYASKTRKRV